MCHRNSGVDTVTLVLTNIEMLTRHKTKTGKPICYGEKANVLIHKQDLFWWFKITVFVKNWPTVFSDWIRPGLYNLDYNKMSSDELYKRKEKAIIDEVNSVLEDLNSLDPSDEMDFPKLECWQSIDHWKLRNSDEERDEYDDRYRFDTVEI